MAGLSLSSALSLSLAPRGGGAVIGSPLAVGSLAHRYFTVGSGPQSFNISSGFSGSGITYSVTSAPAGAVYTINGSTGEMVVQTDDPVNSTADGNVVVRATNSFGYAQQSFPLFVTVAAEFTVLAREANGTVTVESLGTVWTPEITPELDDTFTVSEAA